MEEKTHLLYVSTATEPMTEKTLRAIQDAGLRHNEPAGVHGVLLYRDNTFLQLLEGPDTAVEDIYQRICDDPRHTDVRVLYRGPCTTPMYAHYNMGVIAADEVPGSYADTFNMAIDRASRIVQTQDGLDVKHLIDEIVQGFIRVSKAV
jgi:hypothetical protein